MCYADSVPTQLSDIEGYPLIEDKIHRYWARYARSINLEIDLARSILFDDSGVIVEASANAQGVALVRASLAVSALRKGRLIKLFDANLPGNIGYHIVTPESRRSDREIQRVSKWLRREASKTA
nr:LysR substrate-binding domain-containing protein [Thalassovita mangrovi]